MEKEPVRPKLHRTVNCPRKIQRKMLKNLHAESCNQISPQWTHRARQIVELLNRAPIVQLDPPPVKDIKTVLKNEMCINLTN